MTASTTMKPLLCILFAALAIGSSIALAQNAAPATIDQSSTTIRSVGALLGGGSTNKPTTETVAAATAAATTATTTITTRADDDQDETEPATRTTDTLSVNSDERIATTIAPSDETTMANNESPSNESAESTAVVGIEAKSISHESEGNTVTDDDKKANLMSIEADAGETLASPAVIETENKPTFPSVLNMSAIDKAYIESTRDEQATVESWQKMNKKLKKGITGIIGSLVPFALNMSQEAKISSNCSGAMLKWVLSMNQLKSWALRMLDASGKPIAGLLEGSLTMFGNYRECLKIRAPDDDEIEFAGEFKEYFRGKYCVIQAKPWLPEKNRFYNLNTKFKALMEDDEENAAYDKNVFDELSEWALAFNFVNIRMDFCVPSLCSREDIQKVINYMLNGIDLKARVSRCELDSIDGFQSIVESNPDEMPGSIELVSQNSIQDPSKSFRAQLGWIILPAIAIVSVLIASAISLTPDRYPKATKLKHTIRSLSLKRSVSSHLNIDYDQLADDKPLALYGLRFILVLWVLLVESAINLKFEYLRELLMLKDLIFWWPMQFIINSTLQFDSMILLTAFTMGYKNCLNDCSGNAKGLFKFILDKYIRLMPSIMVLVAIVVLLPFTYRGPVWNDYVTTQSAVCQANGWTNIAFLQNYLPYREICLPQTWLLSVEFQLVVLMAPIVYWLNRSYSSKRPTHDEAKIQKEYGGSCTKQINNLKDDQDSGASSSSSSLLTRLTSAPALVLLVCIIMGSVCSFYNVYLKDLPPSWFYTMADPDGKAEYFSEHLMRLSTHVAVFGIGILAGIECRRAAKNALRGYRRANNLSLGLTNGGVGVGVGIGGCGLRRQQNNSHSSSSSSLPIHSQFADSLSTKSTDINSSTISINIPVCRDGGRHLGDSDSSRMADEYNVMINDDSNSGRQSGGSDGGGSLWSCLFNLIGLLMVLTTMGTIIFSTHDWSLNDLPKPLVAGLYDSVSRFAWSIAMVWILYMISVPDENRKFSCLSRALGHPIMVALGRLSFLIYIIHPLVHVTVLAIQEQPIYSSWLMLFHILIGNITITVILASLVSLFVEMPCRNLFRRCGKSLLLAGGNGCNTSPDVISSTD